MKTRIWLAGVVFAGVAMGADSPAALPVTFHKDVLPSSKRIVNRATGRAM